MTCQLPIAATHTAARSLAATHKAAATQTSSALATPTQACDAFTPQSQDAASDGLDIFGGGNRVSPLLDEESAPNSAHEIFAQARKLIRSATSSIQLEMFDVTNKDMVNLLIAEARKGISVQIVMDPPNDDWEAPRKAAIDKLRKGGVDVRIYPALPPNSPGATFGQLDHVKMLIVDGQKAIIGGMNWGNHSPRNHDFDVKVEGPAVEKMGWMFREDWLMSGGEADALPPIQDVPPAGSDRVTLLRSGMGTQEKAIGKAIRRAIHNARSSIHAELFVLSDRPTVEALLAAKRRGVDVKVILDPLKIKGNPINENAAAALREGGVDVKWYVCNAQTQQKMHAKMAVIDANQVFVGSANWSYAGFNINREAEVSVYSPKTTSVFSTTFSKDWKTRTSNEPIYIEDGAEATGASFAM